MIKGILVDPEQKKMEPIKIKDEDESVKDLLNCTDWIALPLEADANVILVDTTGPVSDRRGFIIDDSIVVYGKAFIVGQCYIVGKGNMCADFTGDKYFLNERIRFLTHVETTHIRQVIAALDKEENKKVEIDPHILGQTIHLSTN